MKKIKWLVIASIILLSNTWLLFAETDPIIDGWVLSTAEVTHKKRPSTPQIDPISGADITALSKEKVGDNKDKINCQWIKLNTNVPFVGNCIETKVWANTTQLNAFPRLMGGMMRLLMTIIMIMSLLMIVIGGVLMTTGGREKSNYSKGMDMIKKVAYGMALLGASGVILKLINPNFFV